MRRQLHGRRFKHRGAEGGFGHIEQGIRSALLHAHISFEQVEVLAAGFCLFLPDDDEGQNQCVVLVISGAVEAAAGKLAHLKSDFPECIRKEDGGLVISHAVFDGTKIFLHDFAGQAVRRLAAVLPEVDGVMVNEGGHGAMERESGKSVFLT